MEIKKVPLSEVELWDKNPRNVKTKDFERLKRQIQELGVYKPLICFKENGKYTTLGGNMRLRALGALNINEVDISVVKPKTEAEKIKYALSDNDRVGQYDEQALAELTYPHVEEINLDDYKLDIGEPISLKDVIEDYAPDIDGEDEVPEIDDSPAITKVGDLFTLGRHRLLCGDATKEGDVKRLMGGEKADMVFTDPPYGLGKEYEIAIKDISSFTSGWIEGIKDYIKFGWLLIFWAAVQLPKWFDVIHGLEFKRTLIWHQPNCSSASSCGLYWSWQPIFLLQKERAGYAKMGGDAVDVFIESFPVSERLGHLTPKPSGLIKRILSKFSESEQLFIDPFLGSGTAIIAAEKLNRICYGMEIEPKYCDVIITRYSNFTDTPEEEIRATREDG